MFLPLLTLLLVSCGPMPEPPPGVSLAFECTWGSIVVLQGWITVSEDMAARAEDFDLERYWLECDTPHMDGLRCTTAP